MESIEQQRLDEEYDALDDAPDFLDEFVAEATAKHLGFPALLDEARERRALARELTTARVAARLNQATVATRVDTAQPTRRPPGSWRRRSTSLYLATLRRQYRQAPHLAPRGLR